MHFHCWSVLWKEAVSVISLSCCYAVHHSGGGQYRQREAGHLQRGALQDVGSWGNTFTRKPPPHWWCHQSVLRFKVRVSLFHPSTSFRTCGKQLCWYLPTSRIWRIVWVQQKSPLTSHSAPSKTTPGTYSHAVHSQERGETRFFVISKDILRTSGLT